jgi:hypothetical protein
MESMNLTARCPKCGERVTVAIVLSGRELDRALARNKNVEVIGLLCQHRWLLDEESKTILRSMRKEGRA